MHERPPDIRRAFCLCLGLLRVVDGLGLAQEIDLDLAGVGQLVLDLLGDVAREQHHLILRDLLGLDHDADLAAGLNGKAVGEPGFGLGLYISREIVTLHGGFMKAKRKEQGLEVAIFLPV